MKKLPQVFLRLVLLAALGVGGFYAYQHFVSKKDTQQIISDTVGRVKGVSESLNLTPESLLDQANQKLIQSQPIIEDVSGITIQEDSSLSDQTKNIIQDAAQKAIDQVKDVPADQAKKITQQVCKQILENLDQ